jgi:signal transduction histidine kinase
MSTPRVEEQELVRELASRLLPTLSIFAFIVAVSAPLAYFWMGDRELRQSGLSTAEQAAEVLARDTEEEPLLWRYDSLKLVEHLRRFRASAYVERIEVTDEQDRLIDVRIEPPRQGLLWLRAPIGEGQRHAGTVWVGMDRGPLRRRALSLLVGFSALAILLAVFVHRIALRSAAGAESRIRSLLHTLAARTADERIRALRLEAITHQEEERRAIARDLHDSVGQPLTALRIQTEVLSMTLSQGGDPKRASEVARMIAKSTDLAIEEVRRSLARLRPMDLDDLGLRSAVTRLAEDVAERSKLEITSHFEGSAEGLPASIETAAYRIVQEALTNVLRHASEATRASVRIVREPGAITIAVEDDGRGRAQATPGRGIRGMSERAELLGGTFTIQDAAPHGTIVSARLLLDGAPRLD